MFVGSLSMHRRTHLTHIYNLSVCILLADLFNLVFVLLLTEIYLMFDVISSFLTSLVWLSLNKPVLVQVLYLTYHFQLGPRYNSNI